MVYLLWVDWLFGIGWLFVDSYQPDRCCCGQIQKDD
jgi:hypothetical protein